MNREEFLTALRARLAGLPEEDVERSLDYYREMLEDRMEDGLGEEDAVAAMGSVEDIAGQILLDAPLPALVRAKVKPNRPLRAWEVVMLALGSPVWVPLLLAAWVVLAAVYVVLWALVVCLWAVELSLAAGAVGGAGLGAVWLGTGRPMQGLLLAGCGLVCAGLAILLFPACPRAAKGAGKCGARLLRWVKSWFIRRK